MRLWIVAIGRLRTGPIRALVEDYAGRSAWPLTVKELEPRKRLSGEALTRHEADLLLGAVPSGATVVALDEAGRDLSSGEFAVRLAGWRDGGVRDVAFLIGGADGHGEAVRGRADLTLAFGRATWPHLMVRAMLAEQVYRAQTILDGHPYHRD